MQISDTWIAAQRVNQIQTRGKPITYRRYRDSLPNLKTGDVEADYRDTAIEYALVGPLTKGDQGSVRVFRFAVTSEIDFRPDNRDQVVYADETYHVFDMRTDQHELVYDVITRKP